MIEQLQTEAGVPDTRPTPLLCHRRASCICRNQGRPINGFIFISPACPIHYALRVRVVDPTAVTEEEIAAWRSPERRPAPKRISYPKMNVARIGTRQEAIGTRPIAGTVQTIA